MVWTDGHIGVSLDGEYAVEARGFNYGVVKTLIANRTWKKWGRLPGSMLVYVDGGEFSPLPAESVPDTGCAYAEPGQNIRKGAKGDGVRWVQWMLEACGFSVGSYGIDGDFGSATQAAVLEAQRKYGLTADGIVGPLTRAALKSALAANVEDSDVSVSPTPTSPEMTEDDQEYQPRGKIADLSKWQGAIDWTAAARELDFCILRAQYGHEKQDERYLEYAKGCQQMDIPYGAYSYCLFDDVETAREEARFLMERIQGTKPGFLVLDLEPGGVRARDIRKEVSAYIAELRALGVKRIGLYIAHHAYQTYNIDVSEADFIWIPRYGSNSGVPEKQPDHPCDLWQYTSNGAVAGVRGRVDLNKLTDETRLSWFREMEA